MGYFTWRYPFLSHLVFLPYKFVMYLEHSSVNDIFEMSEQLHDSQYKCNISTLRAFFYFTTIAANHNISGKLKNKFMVWLQGHEA